MGYVVWLNPTYLNASQIFVTCDIPVRPYILLVGFSGSNPSRIWVRSAGRFATPTLCFWANLCPQLVWFFLLEYIPLPATGCSEHLKMELTLLNNDVAILFLFVSFSLVGFCLFIVLCGRSNAFVPLSPILLGWVLLLAVFLLFY